ncbi:MAG: hypothetical protein EOM72_07175 [Opitutae bacterium]|nr:hypothetical protein [Opitutae bacterium]
MKPASKTTSLLSAGLLAGLILGLASACSSPSAQNRKVYDRYAALVAERNRALNAPADSPAAAVVREAPVKATPPVAHPPSKPAAPKDRHPLKPEPAAKPVAATTVAPAPPPPPVQVIAPPPARQVEAKPVSPPPLPPSPPSPAPPVPAAPPVRGEGGGQPVPEPAASPAYVASPSTDGVAYLLKVGDVVQIFLRGIPMTDAIEDVIDEDGMISLPLINEIQAAGMTASELERNIRKTYLDQDIYRNIAVNVVVPTRYYFIQGEIRAPGRYQIMSATRLSQALAGAGGYTEYASGQVLIKRGGKIHKTIRNAKRLERAPDDDILLEPDDIIEVRRSLW